MSQIKNIQLKNLLRNSILLTSLILITVSCSGKLTTDRTQPRDPKKAPQKEAVAAIPVKETGEISLMTFNVENMFDNTHDEGTEDYTNLPLSEKNRPEVQNYCASISSEYYKKECYEKDWNNEEIGRAHV